MQELHDADIYLQTNRWIWVQPLPLDLNPRRVRGNYNNRSVRLESAIARDGKAKTRTEATDKEQERELDLESALEWCNVRSGGITSPSSLDRNARARLSRLRRLSSMCIVAKMNASLLIITSVGVENVNERNKVGNALSHVKP